MRVLFVYSLQKSITPDKPILGQESIQYGISYISSVLKQNNHDTELIVLDRKYGRKNFNLINKTIQKCKPDLICFTSVHSEFEFITDIAKYIKVNFPTKILIGGGVHITLNPSEELLNIFDCLCVGEGEFPVLEYIECLEKGVSACNVENLWLKEKGEIIKNPLRNYNQNLDLLPFPDRDIWQQWILEKETRLTILLGRGCPYNCTYCCNHKLRKIAGGNYVRLRSPENILLEIENLNRKFPEIIEYFLEVETIGCDMNWLSELCNKLHNFNETKNEKLKFGTNLRVFPNMDIEKVFQHLKLANINSVIIGLESGNERVRKEILNRNYSNENILNAIKIARKYEVQVGIFNMVGLPTETINDFDDTIKMNQLIMPDWHATSIFFPYQGTKLYDLTKELGLLPKKLDTVAERQKAVLSLPGFTKKQIQKSFDSFHYNVYKTYKKKKPIKLFLYFIMKYLGHNTFANIKINAVRTLYFWGLYNFAKRTRLLGVFQKS